MQIHGLPLDLKKYILGYVLAPGVMFLRWNDHTSSHVDMRTWPYTVGHEFFRPRAEVQLFLESRSMLELALKHPIAYKLLCTRAERDRSEDPSRSLLRNLGHYPPACVAQIDQNSKIGSACHSPSDSYEYRFRLCCC